MEYLNQTLQYYLQARSIFHSSLTRKYTEINEVIISLLIVEMIYCPYKDSNWDTVKYTDLPSGVPSGFALGKYFRQRGVLDCISLVSSKYEYSILSNFEREKKYRK